MESCFYETIHETDLLHVRFELQDAPAFVFPAHWHEYVEILYLIRGQFSAIVQATEYRLNEGDLIIINSGDLHMTRSNTCTYLLLQISASQMRQYLPDFDTMRFDTIIPCSEQPAPLRALLSEMNEIRQNPSDSYQLLFTSRLYEFLYHLCRSYSHQIPSASLTGSQRDLQRVTHVMNWVKVHYPEPLSLETAADSLALSKEYFCRLFKKYTGQTFLEYLNDVRTMHLYEDLQNSDETITVLMEKNGLSNYKIFMRTFKKLYGSTPQKMRSNFDRVLPVPEQMGSRLLVLALAIGMIGAGRPVGIGIGTVVAMVCTGRVIALFNHFGKKK